MNNIVEGIKNISIGFSRLFEIGCVILVYATFVHCYTNGYIWCVGINSIGEAKIECVAVIISLFLYMIGKTIRIFRGELKEAKP